VKKATLAEIAHRLGREAQENLAATANPDTILGWYRKFIAKNLPIAIGALGEILVIDTTTLTRSLQLLRMEGLISTSKRSLMRRRFLEITPKGERALGRALPYWRKMQAEFQTAVGPTYWSNLRSELERLAKLTVSLESTRVQAGA
jgi:DNA-binding MarR family transcriptional regulator